VLLRMRRVDSAFTVGCDGRPPSGLADRSGSPLRLLRGARRALRARGVGDRRRALGHRVLALDRDPGPAAVGRRPPPPGLLASAYREIVCAPRIWRKRSRSKVLLRVRRRESTFGTSSRRLRRRPDRVRRSGSRPAAGINSNRSLTEAPTLTQSSNDLQSPSGWPAAPTDFPLRNLKSRRSVGARGRGVLRAGVCGVLDTLPDRRGRAARPYM
jgi:hypothetical protein